MPFIPNLKIYVNSMLNHDYNVIKMDRVLLLQDDSYISSHLIHWKNMGRLNNFLYRTTLWKYNVYTNSQSEV